MSVTPPDFDLACAVALGFVEHPRMTVNLSQMTVLDHRGQPVATFRDWLSQFDKLHAVVRDYLSARQEAQQATAKSSGFMGGGWTTATAIKTRDTANARANAAKASGRQHLMERGVLTRAKGLGLRVNL